MGGYVVSIVIVLTSLYFYNHAHRNFRGASLASGTFRFVFARPKVTYTLRCLLFVTRSVQCQ